MDESKGRCERCGSARLSRLVSRVRLMRHGAGDTGPAAGGGDADMDESLLREMENLDENDPRALGGFMRKMAAQTGESLGEEFDEVVGRLEAGEDPDSIESKMGDALGGGEGMGDMDDPYGMGAPPAPPAAETDDKPTKPEAKAHKASVARAKPRARAASPKRSKKKA